jgi:hypothetical protein
MTKEKDEIKKAYKDLAKEFSDLEEEAEAEKKEVLQEGILEIEMEYKDVLKNTHAMNERLAQLRKKAGMAELIGTGKKVQKDRFKDKKKFYIFLAKEALEVGLDSSRETGGVLLFSDFLNLFRSERPNWEVTRDDLKESLEELARQKLIPRLFLMKRKKILITFKPRELHEDLLRILDLASMEGKITLDLLEDLLGWQKERIELALRSLVEHEIATLDKKTKVYFFPALSR